MTSPLAETADRDEAVRILKEGRRFLLTGHRNPDGDSLGSALGLALALKDAGKEALVVLRDPWPSAYGFLPGLSNATVSETLPEDWPGAYDALLVMESPDAERPGYDNLLAGRVVNIDHHLGNTRYGNVNLIDVPAAAVGEIIADLLDQAGWPMTKDIATNLWVSLVSDTGSFRYGNTTPKALALGARLVAHGAEPGRIGEALFESVPVTALKLESLILGTLKLHSGGRIGTLELYNRFLQESGASPADSENVVNRARSIDSVLAAVLVRETPVEGQLRCSLRSKGVIDVQSVAAQFGGGGHRNAAGCSLSGSVESALLDVVSRVTAVLPALP